MLLRRLVDYAAVADVPPPYRQASQVRWHIALDAAGHAVTGRLDPLGDGDDPKQAAGMPLMVPAVQRSGQASRPFLAADQLGYVLGWIPDNADSRTKALLGRHHAAFTDLINRWAADAPDDGVAQAVAGFYAADGPARLDRPDKWLPTEKVAILVGRQWAHETASAVNWWTAYCRADKMSSSSGICLSCGEPRQLLRVMPQQIKSALIPGLGRDGSLVSVNQPTHPYEPGDPLPPLCEACGIAAMSALTALASDETRQLRTRGDRDAVTVWWTTEPTVVDLDALVDRPGDAEVSGWIARQLVGRHGAGVQPGRLCSATLSGQASRIQVRDWLDVPLPQLAEALSSWRDDQAVVDTYHGGLVYPGLTAMARATGRWDGKAGRYLDFPRRVNGRLTGPADHRPHDVWATLARIALFGAPAPRSLLTHVLRRIHADGHIDNARVALLRLALIRTPHAKEAIMPGLNPDNTDPAYVCGRILAVYERIQYAQFTRREDRPNTTWYDRWHARAVTHPAVALAAGQRDSTAWLRKIRTRGNGGLGAWFESQLTELYRLLPASGPPVALDVYGQARLVAGYWHQRGDMRARTGDNGDGLTHDTKENPGE